MTVRFLPRYGIPAEEVHNLHSRYAKQHLQDGFGSFDAFLRFASESGYQPGMRMRRLNDSEPHGPDNTVFYADAKPGTNRNRKKSQNLECREGFCYGCKEKCPENGIGCGRWRKWFVDDWNEKIHYKPPVEDKYRSTKSRAFFCYEHPDLVREGIVFESSHSL